MQCYLFRVFPKRQKISKNIYTSLIVSIVRTATSVTKTISRKYKLNSTYLKERCWLLWAIEINLFLAISNAKSHSFFQLHWVVVFNLTISWVRENSISFSRTQKSCFHFEEELFVELWVIYIQLHDWRLISVCPVLPWCLLRIVISVDVLPGHQRNRKKSENSICVWKTLLLLLTSTIVFSKINRISLAC